MVIGEDPRCNIRHQAIHGGNNYTADQDAEGNRALGVFCDRYNADGAHRGSLAGPAHNGDSTDYTAKTAVEKSSIIAGAEKSDGIDMGKANDNEENQGHDQQCGGSVLKQRDNAVASDGQQEENGQNDCAGDGAMLTQDGPEAAEIAGKGQGVAGAAERPDHIGPSAIAGEDRGKKHALHTVVTAFYNENARQGNVVPVGKEHIEHADNCDWHDGAACFCDSGPQCDEDAGTYRSADAETDNVPQTNFFYLFLYSLRSS